jgi:hypothetical protein
VLVLVVSSLVVPSISHVAARSDIGYTDLWVREYGWRDLRPRTGWRIPGNLFFFLVKDIATRGIKSSEYLWLFDNSNNKRKDAERGGGIR